MFEEQLLKFLLHDKYCEQKPLQLLKCKATFLIISIEFFIPNIFHAFKEITSAGEKTKLHFH